MDLDLARGRVIRRFLDPQHPERHPFSELDETALSRLTAQLWDQVWWLSLPFWRRWWYRALGYRAPIRRFYEDA